MSAKKYKKVIATDGFGIIFELRDGRYAMISKSTKQFYFTSDTYVTFTTHMPYMQAVNSESDCDPKLLAECTDKLDLKQDYIGNRERQ